MLESQSEQDMKWVYSHPEACCTMEDMLSGFYENKGRNPNQTELEIIVSLAREEHDPVVKVKMFFYRTFFLVCVSLFLGNCAMKVYADIISDLQ